MTTSLSLSGIPPERCSADNYVTIASYRPYIPQVARWDLAIF
jgi:hypothetical protein